MAVFLAISVFDPSAPCQSGVPFPFGWNRSGRWCCAIFSFPTASGPQKEKKETAETTENEKEKNEGKAGKKALLLDTLKRRSIPGLLDLLSEAASLAVSVLKRFLSHVHVSEFDLCLTVCGGRRGPMWHCSTAMRAPSSIPAVPCADGRLPVLPLRRQRRAGFSKKGNRSSLPGPRAHFTVFSSSRRRFPRCSGSFCSGSGHGRKRPQPSPQGIHDTQKGKRG